MEVRRIFVKASMDKLQKLIDIEEIKNLKHRYFRAIDMADFDLLDNVFSQDITIDYRGGTYRWESEGKETIKESLKHAFHNQTAAMHTAHHPEIEVLSNIKAIGNMVKNPTKNLAALKDNGPMLSIPVSCAINAVPQINVVIKAQTKEVLLDI